MACPRSEECCTAVITAFTTVQGAVVPPEDLVFPNSVPVEERPIRTEAYRESLETVLARFNQAIGKLNCECSGACCVAAAEALQSITSTTTLARLASIATAPPPSFTLERALDGLSTTTQFYVQSVDFVSNVACNCNACQCCADVLGAYTTFYNELFVNITLVSIDPTFRYNVIVRDVVQNALLELLKCQCDGCEAAANAIAAVGSIYVVIIDITAIIELFGLADQFVDDLKRFVQFVVCLACSDNCRDNNECCDAIFNAITSLVRDGDLFFNYLFNLIILAVQLRQGNPIVTQEYVLAANQNTNEFIRLFLGSLERLSCQCNNDCCPAAAEQLGVVFLNIFRIFRPPTSNTTAGQIVRIQFGPELAELGADAILSVACSDCSCCEAILTGIGEFFATVRTPNFIISGSPVIPQNLVEFFFRGIISLFRDFNRKLIQASCCATCCETVVNSITQAVQEAIESINTITVNPVPTPVQYQAQIETIIAQFNADAQDVLDVACCRTLSERSFANTTRSAAVIKARNPSEELQELAKEHPELEKVLQRRLS